MKRLVLRLTVVAMLMALLAACSVGGAGERITVSMLTSSNLGYEVDDEGTITVTERSLVFRTTPGSPAAVIDGVQAAYFDASHNLVGEWTGEANSLGVLVPAGFTCTTPHPDLGCTATSAGARPALGQPSDPSDATLQLLSGDVAMAHAILGSPIGWYGVFTFTGFDVGGRFTFTKRFDISVSD